MRRIPLALALVGAVAVTGCMSGSKAPAGTDSDGQQGVAGVNYIIKVVAPAGGAVTSVPAGINCSTAVGAVCSATFAWTQEVVLSAVATAPNVLVAWAGDCEGSALTCTLNGGADKTVVAVYGAPGSGHPNYTAAAVHVPAYNAWVANPTGAVLKCDACHGPTLAGNGIAPSCGLLPHGASASRAPCPSSGPREDRPRRHRRPRQRRGRDLHAEGQRGRQRRRLRRRWQEPADARHHGHHELRHGRRRQCSSLQERHRRQPGHGFPVRGPHQHERHQRHLAERDRLQVS